MTDIVIAHQSVTDRDAIGHDIQGMYDTLKGLGYSVHIYAEYYLGKFNSFHENSSRIRKLSADKDSVLIYNHSIFWEQGERILSEFKGKKIFKFHNITPPEYFKNFSNTSYLKCKEGTEQTKRFVEKYSDCMWWSASNFSRMDLNQYGLNLDRCLIVPPFNVLDELERIEPNFDIVDSLIKDTSNNVLFVGRVAPNKGHLHLIKVLNEYKKMYDSKIHLWVVGGLDSGAQSYNQCLYRSMKDHGLEDDVTFTNTQPIENLKAYYLACDEFLCMSEHEGFCVPIIEAQMMMLPVVTYGGSALSETAGENQVILKNLDYKFAAGALCTINSDEEVKNFLKYNGSLNVRERFSKEALRNNFIKCLDLSI